MVWLFRINAHSVKITCLHSKLFFFSELESPQTHGNGRSTMSLTQQHVYINSLLVMCWVVPQWQGREKHRSMCGGRSTALALDEDGTWLLGCRMNWGGCERLGMGRMSSEREGLRNKWWGCQWQRQKGNYLIKEERKGRITDWCSGVWFLCLVGPQLPALPVSYCLLLTSLLLLLPDCSRLYINQWFLIFWLAKWLSILQITFSSSGLLVSTFVMSVPTISPAKHFTGPGWPRILTLLSPDNRI